MVTVSTDWLPHFDHRLFDVAVMLATTFLFGKMATLVRVPKVTGYIFAGLIFGPSLAHLLGYPSLLSDRTLADLGVLNEVALGLIIFTIGREFSATNLRRLGWPLLWIVLTQAVVVVVLVSAALAVLFWQLIGLTCALLLGLIALDTAPSATLLVLREYDSEGPVTDHLLAMVGLTNVLCITLSMAAMSGVGGAQQNSITVMQAVGGSLGKIGLSVLLGGAIGLGVSYFQTKRLEQIEGILVVFVAILLATGVSRTIGCDSLIANLTIGIVHANSAVRGTEFFTHLKAVDLPFYMMFFFLTGANMHLDRLLDMWPVVLVYALARTVAKVTGTMLGCRITRRTGTLRHYLGWGVLSQAGVAIGLAYAAKGMALREADDILAVILASTVLFEVAGPVALKMAIVAAAEVKVIRLMTHVPGPGRRRGVVTVIDQLRESLGIPGWLSRRFQGEVLVEHVMRRNTDQIAETAQFNEIVRTLEHSRYAQLPVVSGTEGFLGMVSLDDVRDLVFDPALNAFIIARDFAAMPDMHQIAYPQEPIREIVPRFDQNRVQLLPVVDPDDHRRLLGIVTQRDVLAAAYRHGRKGA